MSKRVDRFIRRYNEFFFAFAEERKRLNFRNSKEKLPLLYRGIFLKSENESTIGQGRFDL